MCGLKLTKIIVVKERQKFPRLTLLLYYEIYSDELHIGHIILEHVFY